MEKTIYTQLGGQFSKRMVEIREAAGLTQRGLAKLLKREQSFIARIEQGERRVDMIEFFLICKALKLSPVKESTLIMELFLKAKK
jgi:transcriptional regulator with XRE-family HTH domain